MARMHTRTMLCLFDGTQRDEARQQEGDEAGGEHETGGKYVEGLLIKEVPERRHLAICAQEQLRLGCQLVCLGHGWMQAEPPSAALLGSSGGHTGPPLGLRPQTKSQWWALIGHTTLQS